MPNPLLVGILLLAAVLLGLVADRVDKARCEIEASAKLKTQAVWFNGRCMVKGYVAYRP
ncbi:hypothetical protein ACP3S7_03520 [Phytobacter ursingii]